MVSPRRKVGPSVSHIVHRSHVCLEAAIDRGSFVRDSGLRIRLGRHRYLDPTSSTWTQILLPVARRILQDSRRLVSILTRTLVTAAVAGLSLSIDSLW